MQPWQTIIIEVIGWIYFAAWSISFYGQIYQNMKYRSVEGMNFDFVAMNLTGFTFYSLYNSYGYFFKNDQTGQVDLNDVIFAYHALFATLLCVIQAFMYPAGKNRIHRPTIILLICMWISVIVWLILTLQTHTVTPPNSLGVFAFMGYYKLAISTLKYLPQMYWNWLRKSTIGWSIFNILMDLTGGLLSFLQMLLQYLFGQNISINYVKIILGILVVIYDLIFIFQHYYLYRNNNLNFDNSLKQKNQLHYTQITQGSIHQV